MEYRYIIEIGNSAERARLLVSVEIREAGKADRRRLLPSDKALERVFLRALSEALGELGNN